MLVLKYVLLKKDIYNVQYYKMIRKKKKKNHLKIKKNPKTKRLK